MMISSLCLACVFLPVLGEGNAGSQPAPEPIQELANTIDAYVAQAADRDGKKLPSIVGDDLYLRRVTLDLLGRIPTRDELLAFRAKPNRSELVERLLASQEHPEFWSRLWTNTLLGFGTHPQTDREALRVWLQEQLAQQRGYDAIVRDLIAGQGRATFEGHSNFVLQHGEDSAVPVGRIFLGVQLDCARCHDHPSDRWSQDDFEGMQRFFALARRKQATAGTYEIFDERPGDVAEAQRPVFLTGTRARTQSWRQELALLVTGSKPFQRATANRLWYHFFGHGLSDAVDNINGADRCKDFALAQTLGTELKNHQFDWRPLLHAICISQAYQRETQGGDWPLLPTTKPFSPDQLYESLKQLLGTQRDGLTREQFVRRATGASVINSFTNTWDARDQAQALMVRMQIAPELPTMGLTATFETLLCRPPTPSQNRDCREQQQQDIVFALMHSNEFVTWY